MPRLDSGEVFARRRNLSLGRFRGWLCLFAMPQLGMMLPSLAAADAVDFEKQILPLLQRSCLSCHGPERQKSGYRLDVREIALRGGDSGERAVFPHDASRSGIMKRLASTDPDEQMPPPKSDAPAFSAAEVELLKAWINAGPAWPDTLAGWVEEKPHWSLLPLKSPAVPSSLGKNPIDAFVGAKLATQGLAPSPEADRTTLLRRLTHDLTGLPPALEEWHAFLADSSPSAYEKQVDQLLSSPRYGERWARHWLDTIHFADSHGYEHDIARDNAWRFRDYVISSFNEDKPWPRFVREQLATDFFYPEEPQLTPALGFLGAGTFDLSTFSTATVTFDYLDRDDLVTQTMAAFTSTTANCARCHAHKFDPITQEDYYSLQAVFSGMLKGDISFDETAETGRLRQRWTRLTAAADARDAQALLTADNEPLVAEWRAQHAQRAEWIPLKPDTFVSQEGGSLTVEGDGVLLAGGPRPDKDTYAISAPVYLPEITALRLEVLPHASLPKNGPGRQDNGNLHLSEVRIRLFDPEAKSPRDLVISRATADFNQAEWGIERAIDGNPATAWGIYPKVGAAHYAVFDFKDKVSVPPGSRLHVSLQQLHGAGHLLGALRLSVTGDPSGRTSALPMEVQAALSVKDPTPEQKLDVAAFALRQWAAKGLASLPPQAVVYAGSASVDIPGGDGAKTHKSLPEPKSVHVLTRGDFSKPDTAVQPGALSALRTIPARFSLTNSRSDPARRAALADWIVHPDNVLAWRSIVNRVWHYHFGRGLCDTPSDFGKMGGVPSHPELIDWLAVWFRDEAKGSLKKLHRLILTSETYRQSSQWRRDAAMKDTENRLLWRQNRQRLDADGFRDHVLAVSGRLDLAMGGPGIRHFQASKGPQATPTLDYTAYDWSSAGAGRRSVYRFVWRGIADPFMEALDFPDLGLLTPSRSFSVSGLQALSLYNSDFLLYHAEEMSRRLTVSSNDLNSQVVRAVELTWLRIPNKEEVQSFSDFAKANGLPALCRVLLNSNAFLFLD